MRIKDLLTMGFKNLWRRKARSFLTIFGVIIGATSIILMVSIGLGQERQMYQLYESFGDIKTIRVMTNRGGYFPENEKDAGKINKDLKLDDESIKNFESIEGVDIAVGFKEAWGSLYSGRYQSHSEIIGVDLNKFAKMGVKITTGKMPEPGTYQVIAGEQLQENFYNPRSRRDFEPIKVDMMKEEVKYYYQGEYSEKGKKRPTKLIASGLTHRYSEYGYGLIMDIEVLKKIMKEDLRKYPPSDAKERKRAKDQLKNFTYDTIKVVAKKIDDVSSVQETIKNMGYRTYSPIEYIEQSRKQMEQQKLTLLLIGSVSLFVAAIGIANTMIMSIYERTREIGVMKVLGAEVNDILKLFLLEAGIIGMLGGIAGSLCSIVGSNIINELSKNPSNMEASMMMEMGMAPAEASYIPPWLLISAVGFSILIGLISGLLPAIKATKLSALEAIKTNS